MKNEIIKLNVKKQWQVGRGHTTHNSGAGVHHDSRTKRCRTRQAQQRKAIDE